MVSRHADRFHIAKKATHEICFKFAVLELAGLRDLFDVVVGNEDYSRHKPSPDAFLTACEKLNVDPAKCWGLEDT